VQRKALLILIASLTLATLPAAFASTYKPIYPEFPEIRESKAYKKFAVRPLSDLSKILYLIDRFGESKIEVVYDNQSYPAPFATAVARWFLARNYKKQTPENWVKEWCSHSIMTNKLVYVRLPNGDFLLARDVLLAEIKAINQIIRENQVKKDSAQAVADVPLAKPAPGSLVQTLPAGPKTKLS
jgi:hypothetical protein